MKLLLSLTLFLFTFLLVKAGLPGCTDPLAENYNPTATHNDGSCVYGFAIVSPSSSWLLPSVLDETSGLIIWNDKIWTHNDDNDINLYSFDTTDVNNYTAWPLTGTVNIDWEEISQDDEYIYVGDFGNNYNGNRTNLQILRVEKNSLLAGEPQIDTIAFSYSLQTDFSATGSNNTDFDCEAFIVSSDSIFLFTKEWVSQKTTIFSLPKQPGEYVAQFRGSYNVQGLITGSAWLEEKRLIVLTGYSTLLQPFMILLYDFQGTDFLSGNKRRINLGQMQFHQVEAIATNDGLIFFLSNEFFSHSVVTVPQQLHLIDLSPFLSDYLQAQGGGSTGLNTLPASSFQLYPNPVMQNQSIHFTHNESLTEISFSLISLHGQVVLQGLLSSDTGGISLAGIRPGIYFFIVEKESTTIRKLIVQ